ncbi:MULTISPECIES: hypothetical protein [unclassified Enterococcus]|uniref:hypothetical protein n=1 Tax=unclassified Enterococcus TaxID=2608891 RepID=UPI001F16F39C|nr:MULTISPECIES: hypothetical protein [unclassified Enterococcus]
MKKILGLLLPVILIGVLAGCSTAKNEEANVDSQSVGIAITGDAHADALDATSYDSEMAIYSAVYEPLITYGEKGDYGIGRILGYL